ncbi:inositol-1-monophosphatase [Candidatus Regiella endosymbiont of Tuberolachnus salignus]|uniref:inositol-1-monophosphatase n=1 Tax=Candidatus Regiella endosymbiont of Tuberolachnus salignus TaxID=3077956 RepID=UPI0030CDBBDA
MHPMLTIAIRAARKAGDLIAKYYAEPQGSIKTNKKNSNDFAVDKSAERLIINVIRDSYPSASIISQKCPALNGGDNETQWIISSLDENSNFTKRLPHCAVSIAVRIKTHTKAHTEVAVIYDAIRNELFTAVRGQGAQLNGYRLRIPEYKNLTGTTLAAGISIKAKQHAHVYYNLLSQLSAQCDNIHSSDSPALDLAYIAAGRVDGFFAIGLSPCSFAGGELLVREAGALVTDFVGGDNYYNSGNLVAGSPRVVETMQRIMDEELTAALRC